jgi:uncharacterized OB-fold protein
MSHALADPRPQASRSVSGITISGWRCQQCAYPYTQEVLRCPVCHGTVAEDTFATSGVVFASTCMRVRVPGHTPPFAMAYLVLDGGPRILVHTGTERLVPGTRATIKEVTEEGDLFAVTDEEVAA